MPLTTIIDYQRKCIKNNKPTDFAIFFKVSTALIEYEKRDLELCRMNKELNFKLRELESKNRELQINYSKMKAEVEDADRIILELENQNENLKSNLSL